MTLTKRFLEHVITSTAGIALLACFVTETGSDKTVQDRRLIDSVAYVAKNITNDSRRDFKNVDLTQGALVEQDVQALLNEAAEAMAAQPDRLVASATVRMLQGANDEISHFAAKPGLPASAVVAAFQADRDIGARIDSINYLLRS